MLFLRINASFKLHLKRQLARLGVVNDGGPQHGSEPLPVPVAPTPRLISPLLHMLINEVPCCFLCRLVVVDVAFYTENIQALRSLERLDLNMPEIWEQKR